MNQQTSVSPSNPAAVRQTQSDLERQLLPGWLDKDPAADQPNYLGYIMSVLPALLVAVLCFMGMTIFLHG
ncbi:MAG: hypothetical protein OSA97_06090 [Nevskia sp.]|nr:hypothetical protein [Nevskia sp.]